MTLIQNFYSIIVDPFRQRSEEEKLDYLEILGISWLTHFIHAFYSVLAVYIGIKTYEAAANTNSISQMVYTSFNLSLQKFSIILGLSEAIFYPIVFHFSYQFWNFLLKFYVQIFNLENEFDFEERSEPILAAIYASNIFLLLPIFGKVASYLAQGFYLYKGLIKNLEFTNLQAFLVLLTPLFLIFLFAVLLFSYFAFLFSLL